MQSHCNKLYPEIYLNSRYSPGNVGPLRRDVPLREIHGLFKTYTEGAHCQRSSLKVLDYGCGPSLQTTITAAAYSSDIVLADYTERNLYAVRRWLGKDPNAFNWSTYFNYVVQTLEGGTEQQATEREDLLRKAVKAVVHCDITQDCPIQKGYEGPYDVILNILGIANGCKTPDEYTIAVSKLTECLLKPGGVIGLYNIDREPSGQLETFSFADEIFNELAISADFVKTTFEQAGLCDITMTRHPMIGTVFISATKPV